MLFQFPTQMGLWSPFGVSWKCMAGHPLIEMRLVRTKPFCSLVHVRSLLPKRSFFCKSSPKPMLHNVNENTHSMCWVQQFIFPLVLAFYRCLWVLHCIEFWHYHLFLLEPVVETLRLIVLYDIMMYVIINNNIIVSNMNIINITVMYLSGLSSIIKIQNIPFIQAPREMVFLCVYFIYF